MSHTKEPWSFESGVADNYIIYDEKDEITIGLIGQIEHSNNADVPSKERQHNAARVVSCVNACTGIKNTDLESGCIQKLVEAAREFDLNCECSINGLDDQTCVHRTLESALEPYKGIL